jgi:ribulose-phosphate 3-epimerase
MHQLSPSLLSADFSCLKESVEIINHSSASYIHCDIMDGVFVPNISFGFPVLEAVAKIAKRPLDIHLMIVKPSEYISRFAAYQPEYISVHYESEIHLHRTLSLIRSHGVKAGVVLNPHTPVKLLEDILEHTDLVLLMSVNPGYGGQQFIEGTYRKIEKLRKRIVKPAQM